VPSADIANLAMGIVVPPLAWYRTGHRFAKLMRAGGGQSIYVRHPARAPRAIRKRHYGVVNAASQGVVIAAERLAGPISTLHHRSSGWKVDEINRVGVGFGTAELLLISPVPAWTNKTQTSTPGHYRRRRILDNRANNVIQAPPHTVCICLTRSKLFILFT
jgi:hypothetical protein